MIIAHRRVMTAQELQEFLDGLSKLSTIYFGPEGYETLDLTAIAVKLSDGSEVINLIVRTEEQPLGAWAAAQATAGAARDAAEAAMWAPAVVKIKEELP